MGTTPGVARRTTFGCWRRCLASPKQGSELRRRISSRNAGSQGSGGGDERGITISRRPNMRPSRENAPGPSNAIATAVIIIPKDTSLASCKPQKGAGNHEKAIPRKHSPTKRPAYGVRNPIARATPATVRTKPITPFSKEVSGGPERYRTPAEAAAKPTAARKSNKPIPGLPPGNVEYNLCSAYLLARPQ